MNAIRYVFARLYAQEDGAAAIEYAIILGMMVIALVAALTSLGAATDGALNDAADGITT
jgi:Flp pilus assembly pilin Flp